MSVASVSQAIYESLLQTPGDVTTMLVLSDALSDEGREELAAAYRWAAERKKWPAKIGRGVNKSYDWDMEGRDPRFLDAPPPECRLPEGIYTEMCRLVGRMYGGVDLAFIILANVLAGRSIYKGDI